MRQGLIILLVASLLPWQSKLTLDKKVTGQEEPPLLAPAPPDEAGEPNREVPPISQSLWSVKVFIHVYAISHYANILKRQMLYLHYSGLYERCDAIHVFIGGPDDREVDRAATMPPYYGDKYVVHIKYQDTSEERLTLEGMFDLITPNDKILYLHSKGVRYGAHHKPVTQWRVFMEYFNIRYWRLSLCLLDEYDTVGVGYNGQLREYCGNFWWVTGRYYLSLPRTIPRWPGTLKGHDAPEDFLLNNSHASVFNLAVQSGSGYSESKMPPHLWDTLWTKDMRHLAKVDRCYQEAAACG